MILPRRGRTACTRRSRPSLAEPPAEAPSTRKSSRYCGSRSEHSASLAASPSSSTPFLRVSSRALRAASRAWAARTHLSAIFRERFGELVVDDLLDQALDVAVAELGLRLPFELRLRQPHRDHGRQAFADVVSGHPALEALEESVGLRVARERAGQRGAKAGEVRAALARVDVVREREDALLVAVVVLQRHLDLDVALLALEEQHLGMQRGLVLVQMLDELDDPALVEERVAPRVTLVLDDDLEAAIEERQLAQPVAERVEGKRGVLEDGGGRLEADDRAGLLGGAGRGERARRHTELVALRPLLAVAADLELEPLAERVHHRDPDAVQTAGHLVGGVLELAAGVQDGQHDFRRRLAALLVDVDGDATAVVADRARAVRVQDDLDAVAVAGERLVDRVVDRLVDEVMQAVGARVADVHRGALADRLEAFEDLDVARGVVAAAHAGQRLPPLTWNIAAPFTTGASGVVRNTCSAD